MTALKLGLATGIVLVFTAVFVLAPDREIGAYSPVAGLAAGYLFGGVLLEGRRNGAK